MIRVLHVFSAMNRGGAESRTMDIYRHIDREKIQFDFMVHSEEPGDFDEEIRALGGKIYAVPRYKIYNRIAYRRAWRDFLSVHPEIQTVHIHMTNVAGEILPVLVAHNIPKRIVHSRCASNPGVIRNAILRLSQKNINALATHRLAVSTEAAEYVFRTAHAVEILPGSIDAQTFQYNEEIRRETRKELGASDNYVLGHVARFDVQKNHDFLLRAFRDYASIRSDALLFLIGDGALRKDIEKTIGEYHLQDRVVLFGVRRDIPRIMQALDLFVLPSLFEGLPGTVIEAQAAGLPCLVSDKVSRECSIVPGYVRFLPIDQGTDIWVNAFDEIRGFPRKNTTAAIEEAGFDAERQVKRYEELYTNE